MQKFFFTIICFFMLPSMAFSHGVYIFAWVDGDHVFTQAKFAGGKKVKQGKVSVYGPDDVLFLTGKTDDNGEFSFKIPKKTRLEIKLDASMGHGASWVIPESEINNIAVVKADIAAENSAPQKSHNKTVSASAITADKENSPCPNIEEIEKAVNKVLDKRLKPLIIKLADAETKGPGLKEILGGLGYILGLMGLGMYFHYRKKIKELTHVK